MDAQKRSIDDAKISEKRATDAATQLAESVRRFTELEKSAKLATKKRVDMNCMYHVWLRLQKML